MKLIFYLQSKYIYLRVTHNGWRYDKSVGMTSYTLYKDKKTSVYKVLSKEPGYKGKNERLFKIQDKILNIFEEAKSKNLELSKGEFLRKYEGGGEFINVFNEFLESQSVIKDWSKGTIKQFKTFRNNINRFDPNLKMKNLTPDKIDEFIEHQLYTVGKINSSVNVDIKRLRWFLNWAKKKDYYYYSVDINLRKGNKLKNVFYLTYDEVLKLLELPISDKLTESVRDGFCLGCFTGLRHSDFIKVSYEDMKGDRLYITTEKNLKQVQIPLLMPAVEILSKYKGVDKPFNFANQTYNKYLKYIGRIAGLDDTYTKVSYRGSKRIEKTYYKYEKLSTHAAKRTFVTYMIMQGFSIPEVCLITGNDEKTIKPYYEISQSLINEKMKKLNKVLAI